jgi:hypothetical protein
LDRTARELVACTPSGVGAGNKASTNESCRSAGNLLVLTRPVNGRRVADAAGSGIFDLLGWTPTAVPLAALHPTGGSGCSLLVHSVAISFVVPVGGSASVQLAIPNAVAFVGIVLHDQVVQAEVDPLLNLLSITSTNGIAFTIGSF